MSTTRYPKILLVNNSSRLTKNATGITLNSIFSNWPSENIMEISCTSRPEKSGANNIKIYSLSKKNYPAFLLMRSKLFNKINETSKRDVLISKKKLEKHGKFKYFINSIKKNIRTILIAYFDIMPLFNPLELTQIALKYNPDFIYTMGGSIISMKLTLFFANKCKKPIVIHFMDNWQDTLYNEFFLTKPCHIMSQKLLKNIYSKTKVALTISNAMATEYSNRWGVKHVPLMNTVSIISDKPNVYISKDITITYTGGLHLSRWESLLDLGDVIEDYNNKYEINIILNIYTSDNDRRLYKHLFNEKFVIFNDYVEHGQIRNVYSKSDILIHIESFSSKFEKFVKYSMSTKIPEYMASGKPLLVYAPEDYAVSSYIRNYQAGLAVKNKEELQEKLIKLITNCEFRYHFANNAIKLVKSNHTISNCQNVLKQVFDF